MSAICSSTTIKRKKRLAACQFTRLRADWEDAPTTPFKSPLELGAHLRELTSATPGAAAKMLPPSRLGDLQLHQAFERKRASFYRFLFPQYFGQSLQHAPC
jgi:hypothetical protein